MKPGRITIGLAAVAVAAPAWAQTRIEHMVKPTPPAGTGQAIFADSGYGKRWLGDFFPYQLPNAGDLHAAFGQMLSIYNTGVLVLAAIVALYSFIMFVVESAHHGRIGGQRNSALYAQLRLIVAIALLVPVSNGYSAAQIIIVNLAHAGSGLANTLWSNFSPIAAATDFNLPQGYDQSIDGVLQKALISETCMAAVQLDSVPSTTGDPSVTIQAFYSDPGNPARQIEGIENELSIDGKAGDADATTAESDITTESIIKGLPVSHLRLHYNRSGYDDYCGAVDLPVPAAPTGVPLVEDDQAIFAEPLLQVRPTLAKYASSMASAVASKLAPVTSQPGAGTAQTAPAAPAAPTTGAAPPTGKGSPTAPAAVELPQATMSASAWVDLVKRIGNGMAAMADKASHDYIDKESQSVDLQPKSTDWAEAGSLFFKLTKLSHDNLKLRHDPVTATLPDPAILPAEMRNDGALAACAPVLDNVFLADYHCRQDGRKTTLSIKVAYNLIHTIESQRGNSVVPAIDGSTAADRKEDTLSRQLFADAGLDAVVAELAAISSRQTVKGQHSAMFDLVNVGNILLTSTSGLFQQSTMAGQLPGGTSQSLLLSLFAVLLVVPALFLSIMLPLLPAVRFFLGIVTWMLAIFEGMVIFPLVILGSLRGEGDGLFTHLRQGYIMLLQMMMRPVLMVFGMMAALLIFDALYEFATWAIWSGLLDLGASSGQLISSGVQGVLELTGYLFLWTFLIYIAANLSFRAITVFPDRALVWMGSIGATGQGSTAVATSAPPQAGTLAPGTLAPGPAGTSAISGRDHLPPQISSSRDAGDVTAIDRPAAPPSGGRRQSDHFPRSRHEDDAAPGELAKKAPDEDEPDKPVEEDPTEALR